MSNSVVTLPYGSQAAVVPYFGSKVGRWYVLSVPYFAVVVALRGESLSAWGFNYTGFLWVFTLAFGCVLLFMERGMRPDNRSAFPALPWLAWLMLAFASFIWMSEPGVPQMREALHMATPILVAMVASLCIRTREQLAQLIRAFYIAMPLLWIPVVLWAFFGLRIETSDDVFVEVRWIGFTAVFIGGLFIAETRRHTFRGWAGWAMCLAITIATGGRMASLVMLLLPLINPIVRNPIPKIYIGTAMVIVGLAMLSTPIFQERFFGGGSGDVNDIMEGNFDSAGRFDIWPLILERALERPWLGHGVGDAQILLPELHADITYPHNDYLRLGYELGIVGIVATLLVVLWQVWCLGRLVHRTDGVVQQAFAASWLGFAVLLPIAFTGNPLCYTLSYMHPVFALMGAAYAVNREESLRSQSGQTQIMHAARGESYARTPAAVWNFRRRNSFKG